MREEQKRKRTSQGRDQRRVGEEKREHSRISTPSNPTSIAVRAASLNFSTYSTARKGEEESQSEKEASDERKKLTSNLLDSQLSRDYGAIFEGDGRWSNSLHNFSCIGSTHREDLGVDDGSLMTRGETDDAVSLGTFPHTF